MRRDRARCIFRFMRTPLVFTLLLVFTACGKSLPEGKAGPQADALARALQEAVNHEAWNQTGAVRWNFDDRRTHLWDRERDLIRVRWDDIEVLRHAYQNGGRVWEDGQEVLDPEKKQERLQEAYEIWINDAFWLNPIATFFDAGVTRKLVALEDGRQGLLVQYGKGGVTPGDTYLWASETSGLPEYWEMWVSIIPIGGLRTTWEAWDTLSTGAKVSTRHALSFLTLEIKDVAGATSLAALEPGPDPFASIVADEPKPDTPTVDTVSPPK